jgi:hypothetical protein
MFGVPLIGPADIICDAKAERVVAQIGGYSPDFDEATQSDVKMLTESLSGQPTNVRIHVSHSSGKEVNATIDWAKTKTEPPRYLRLSVWKIRLSVWTRISSSLS